MGAVKAVGQRARGQHGLFTHDQAIGSGLSPSSLRNWVGAGKVERVLPRVYRLAGAPVTWEQRVLAVVLSTGGIASHRSAAAIWGLWEGDEIDVTVSGNGRRWQARERGELHRTADLAKHHSTTRHGIPVTTPMRTLADLGAVLRGDDAVGEAVERALLARVCSIRAIEHALDDVARKGRAGAGILRRTLDKRALGRARPEGLLEARMARIMREHGLPPPRFQHNVRDRAGRLIARVDFAYPDITLAIEVDGFQVHSTPSAFQRDLERQNRLVAAGWTVLRFTWLDVVRRPEWVVAQIAGFLRDRAAAS